jgi:hypothetical protein
MTPADLAKFEPQRRYATLVALAVEGLATVTDEIIELHERIIGRLFAAARNKHQQQFQASGKPSRSIRTVRCPDSANGTGPQVQ